MHIVIIITILSALSLVPATSFSSPFAPSPPFYLRGPPILNPTIAMTDGWAEVPTRGGRTARTARKRECESNDEGGRRPFVLVLVGIPGSGKSHFATRLETALPGTFVRVSQDVLGNRRKCEARARRALAQGQVAVIDRCNFDDQQRKTWRDIAEQARVRCECVVFLAAPEACVRRCQQRRTHETIAPRAAAGVVAMMAQQFRPPVPGARLGTGPVECASGERFHRLEQVSSFGTADALVESYLGRR